MHNYANRSVQMKLLLILILFAQAGIIYKSDGRLILASPIEKEDAEPKYTIRDGDKIVATVKGNDFKFIDAKAAFKVLWNHRNFECPTEKP